MPKGQTWILCKICRRNHDQGRHHLYSTKHKTLLEQCLSKAKARVAAFRDGVKSKDLSKFHEKESFWCYFCDADVKREAKHDPR